MTNNQGLSEADVALIGSVFGPSCGKMARNEQMFEFSGAYLAALLNAARAEGPQTEAQKVIWGDLDDAPNRVAFVRDTLTRLMEENGGPHCRQARIQLSGSTVAAWLIQLGSLAPAPSPPIRIGRG